MNKTSDLNEKDKQDKRKAYKEAYRKANLDKYREYTRKYREKFNNTNTI